MSFQVSAPPSPSASPPRSGSAPPGEPPGKTLLGSAFAQLLARTAPAEGLNQTQGEPHSTRSQGQPRHEERAPRRDAAAAAQASSTSTGALAQVHTPPVRDTPLAITKSDGGPSSDTAGQTGGAGVSDHAATAATARTAEQSAGAVAASQADATTAAGVDAQASAPSASSGTPDSAQATRATSAPVREVASSSDSAARGGGAPPATTSEAGEQAPAQAASSSAPAQDSVAHTAVPQAQQSGSVTATPAPATQAPESGDSTAGTPSASAGGALQSVTAAAPSPAPRSATGPVGARAGIVRSEAAAPVTTSAFSTAPSAGSEPQQTSSEASAPGVHAATSTVVSAGAGAVSADTAAPVLPVGSAEASSTSALAPNGTPSAAPASAGVALQDMIESIHATIELAAKQGMAQARIALEPEELGSVRIHLSQTADGLLARVSADTPEAAQALAGGRVELQQSLSSLGVSLLRLDINSSGQSETRDQSGRSAHGGRTRASGSSVAILGGESEGPPAVDDPHESSPRLDGALVDVLA